MAMHSTNGEHTLLKEKVLKLKELGIAPSFIGKQVGIGNPSNVTKWTNEGRSLNNETAKGIEDWIENVLKPSIAEL